MSGEQDVLVDRIYEAAVRPSLWPSVLAVICDELGGSCGTMSRQCVVTTRGASIRVRMDPAITDAYWRHYHAVDPLAHVDNPEAFLEGWRPRILTDEQWMPKADLVGSEYYNDYLKPLGIHSYMFIRLARRGSENVFIGVGRPKRRGPYERAEMRRAAALHPHLIRAFRLSETIAEAGSGEVAFELARQALIVVDADARLRHANAAAREMLARGEPLQASGGRIGPADLSARKAFLEQLARAAGEDEAGRCGGALALAGERGRWLASIAPLGARGLEFFDGGRRALICLTDAAAPRPVSAECLQQAFGLTCAEARVALALFSGLTKAEIARRFGSSFFTVRGHLARVFDKTGVHRQAELIALLSRLAGPHP